MAFRRALAARPGNVEALIGLGRAAQAAGDQATAEAAFRRAIELEPSFAVYNQLGALVLRLRPLRARPRTCSVGRAERRPTATGR